MSRLGELLGSVTKGNIVEALALSEEPLTCYRISRSYNMNVAKTYIAMKKLARIGLVAPSKDGGSVKYLLLDEDLRRIALKLSSRVMTYRAWSSQDAKRERFRSGFVQATLPPLGMSNGAARTKPTRIPGELESLALLARRKFDAKYRMSPDGEYDRI